MSRYGYQGLTVENFVGFHPTLTSGQWAEVDLTPHAKEPLHMVPVLVFFKTLLVEAIDGLVAAQGAHNDVQRSDGPWDDAQRRFVLTVQLKAIDADPAVRADAEAVQAQLCPGGTTAMTSLPAEQEVDFARNQLALARAPKLAPTVARLGLGGLLAEIERCTHDLAQALGRGAAERGAMPRSKRIARAVQDAVGAFNLAHTGLDHLAGAASTPEERALLASMVAPFHELLARRVVAAKAAAPPANEDATKKDEAPTEEVRPTG